MQDILSHLLQEAAALETEQKLANILDYLANQAGWSPAVKTPRAPHCSVVSSTLDMTPKMNSDLDDSGSLMSPHGVTLPGKSASFTDDSQSMIAMDDYDIPQSFHSNEDIERFTSVSPAVQPPRAPAATTFNSQHQFRSRSSTDLEPLNRKVRRMNLADRVPCDGKEDTPHRFLQTRNVQQPARPVRHSSDTDLKKQVHYGTALP